MLVCKYVMRVISPDWFELIAGACVTATIRIRAGFHYVSLCSVLVACFRDSQAIDIYDITFTFLH